MSRAIPNRPPGASSLDVRMATMRAPRRMLVGVLRMRRSLRTMRSRLGPVNADIIERTLAVAEARALGIAAELDIAEIVEREPRTATSIAANLQVDADALERLLELLASTGCFRRDNTGRWHNTRVSATLCADHPLSMRDWARFFGGGPMTRIWAAADEAIRTGDGVTREVMGAEFFEWTRLDPEAGSRFDGAMREASRFLGRSIATAVDFGEAAVVCDVGGGTGAVLAEIVQRHPSVRGVLFDLPHVVTSATPMERVEVVGGSFFEAVPTADRHVLVSVVHDWDDERAQSILEQCRKALAPGGRVLVVEQVLDPDRAPLFERATDFLMLVLTGAGRERTDSQFRGLFAAAGLTVTRTWHLPTLHGVYELAPT